MKKTKEQELREKVAQALKQRKETKQGASNLKRIVQRGQHLLAPPRVPDRLDIKPTEMWYVRCSRNNSFDWKGFLKALGFRWSGPARCWVLDRVTQEHAEWVQELVLAWAGDRLKVNTSRGLFVERISNRRNRPWEQRVD